MLWEEDDTSRRKLSVEIAEQLQHNAARTKRGAGCAVNYNPPMYERNMQKLGHGDAKRGGGWYCGGIGIGGIVVLREVKE